MFNMVSLCIDEDELESIFLENKKGRHVHDTESTGIGLYIVRKALSYMGAKIHVTNDGFYDEREGSKYCTHTFVITFKNNS